MGRTTGFTTGTMETVNTTVNVNYGSGCGTPGSIGQVVITPGAFSAPADSGSLILGGLDSANRRRPVALLFAGSSTITVGNRIADVLGALHISSRYSVTDSVSADGLKIARDGSSSEERLRFLSWRRDPAILGEDGDTHEKKREILFEMLGLLVALGFIASLVSCREHGEKGRDKVQEMQME